MADEIDKFFSSQKEQQEKKDEARQQVWRKQKTFIADFKKSLSQIIHPAMLAICHKLRKKDCNSLWLRGRREKSNPLSHIKGFDVPPKTDAETNMLYRHYENYYVAAPRIAEGVAFIFTVLGNYSAQEVCVITEYVKHNRNALSSSVKKTTEQYPLEKMTTELFDAMIADRMKEMLAIKQQTDENKPLLPA